MSEPKAEREGEVLAGKYRLEALLGEGGMGEVYRAHNVLIGRDVAIKLLRAEHAHSEAIVARFMREARAANLVRHPSVVDVLDVGRDEAGTPFIVQELLDGEDLGSFVAGQGGKLTLDLAVQWLAPVVDAVAVGHANGVVHRDLKPENVFLARGGGRTVPKLLDFGISQIRANPGESKMTLAGMVMGTPWYMAPEQVRGGEIDARADVWALGVILYELLSGVRPFDAESHPALFVVICTADPKPLRDVAPDVPAPVSDVVARCLQRDREARFADAAELATALRAAVERSRQEARLEARPLPKVPSLAPPPPPPRPPRSSRKEPAARPERAERPPVAVAAASPPAPRGSGIALASARPPPPRDAVARAYAAPPRADTREAVGVIAALFVGVGAAIGLFGGWLALGAVNFEGVAGTIEQAWMRAVAALAVGAPGVIVAVRAYRSLCEDPPNRTGAVASSSFGAALVYVALRLLVG